MLQPLPELAVKSSDWETKNVAWALYEVRKRYYGRGTVGIKPTASSMRTN